jgi:hypothetical protein
VTNVAKVARGEVKFDEKGFAALKECFAQGTWTVAELRQEMQRRKLPQLDVERTLNLMAATGVIVPCALGVRPKPIPTEAKQVRGISETNRALIKRMSDNLLTGNAVSVSAGSAIGIDPIHALIITLLQQPWKNRAEARERLKEEVQRRRIRFNRGPTEAKGADGKEEIKAGDKAVPGKEGVIQGKIEIPADDAMRGGQYFDKFFAVEGPLLHRLGILELV